MNIIKTLFIIVFISLGITDTACAQKKSSTKIKMEELPKDAHALIHGKYAKYKVNSISRDESVKSVVTYEIELQKKAKIVYLEYDADGVLVNTRKSKEYIFDGSEKPKRSTGGSGGGHSGHTH